jgi:hypothetical protein
MLQQRIQIDDLKDSFYKKLECVFNKYHMKIVLGDLIAKAGKEEIFKPTTGN